MIYWDTATYGWVYGWMGRWMDGFRSNLIKLELIDIIWFCLKIYNLWRHPHLRVDGWVNGWAHVKSLKSNKSWPNWENSIMDILDFFWIFYLNHLSPLWGYFLWLTSLWVMANRVIFDMGGLVDNVSVYAWRINDMGSMSLIICRGHVGVSKGCISKIFCSWWFYM